LKETQPATETSDLGPEGERESVEFEETITRSPPISVGLRITNWPPVIVTDDGMTQTPFLHSAVGTGLSPTHEGETLGHTGTLQPARVQPQSVASIKHLLGSDITVGWSKHPEN
jgi:hypothetical protein